MVNLDILYYFKGNFWNHRHILSTISIQFVEILYIREYTAVYYKTLYRGHIIRSTHINYVSRLFTSTSCVVSCPKVELGLTTHCGLWLMNYTMIIASNQNTRNIKEHGMTDDLLFSYESS